MIMSQNYILCLNKTRVNRTNKFCNNKKFYKFNIIIFILLYFLLNNFNQKGNLNSKTLFFILL